MVSTNAKHYARLQHSKTGCFYDGKPYDVHLSAVEEEGEKYKNLLTPQEWVYVERALSLHDVIEDCRVNYNDLVQEFGEVVSDIVYNVTNELGRNRKERAIKTYPKIASCRMSTFVKLCDRIANMKYNAYYGTSMLPKYQAEYTFFKQSLYHEDFIEMWNELDYLNY